MSKIVYRDDNFFLTIQNGVYQLGGMADGKRIRQSCRTTNFEKAKRILEKIKREHDSGWHQEYDNPDRDWKDVVSRLHAKHQSRAKYNGIPFDLTASEAYNLMKATDFRCAVSGIPFSKRFAKAGEADPWSPSIDRIEPRQGYTAQNVRVVCLIANLAMNTWGSDALLRLARGVVASSKLVSQQEAVSQRYSDEEMPSNNLILFEKKA